MLVASANNHEVQHYNIFDYQSIYLPVCRITEVFSDNGVSLTLVALYNSDDSLTIAPCKSLCRSEGFTHAGAECGSQVNLRFQGRKGCRLAELMLQCYCGESFDSRRAIDASNYVQACAGGGTGCGGLSA